MSVFDSAAERRQQIEQANREAGRPWWRGLHVADVTPDEWRRLPDAAKDELERDTLQGNARKLQP